LDKILKPIQDKADEAEALEYDLRHNTENQHKLNKEELDKLKSKVDRLKKAMKTTKKAERSARNQKSIVNRFKSLFKTAKIAMTGPLTPATKFIDVNEIVIDLVQVSKDALEDTANNISRITHTLPKNIENIEMLLKEQEEGAESLPQQDLIIKKWTKAKKDIRLVEFWKHSQTHRDWVLNHPTKEKYNLINQEARLRGVYPIVLD
jgi:cysteinyl-tRNA synthetase